MEDSFSGQDQYQHLEYEEHWEEEESQQGDDEPHHKQNSAQRISSENKKSTNYSYQAQKIIINDLEDNESPTYMDFFGKEQQGIQALSNETENLENKKESHPPRWEILYERAKGARQAKEDLRKEYESQQVDPECTFKPRIISSTNNRMLYTTESMENEHSLTVHERNKLWKSRVENKLLESRESFKDRDLLGCTFKPNLLKSQSKDQGIKGLTGYGSKGVDLYLRRRIIANQHREEKEKILENPLTKLPSHVYKKDGTITIPKGPEFNKGKTMEINSLKKPLDFPIPKPLESYNTLENLSPERAMSPQKASRVLVDPIKVNNIKFGDAIQKLHRELHRMNIN